MANNAAVLTRLTLSIEQALLFKRMLIPNQQAVKKQNSAAIITRFTTNNNQALLYESRPVKQHIPLLLTASIRGL